MLQLVSAKGHRWEPGCPSIRTPQSSRPCVEDALSRSVAAHWLDSTHAGQRGAEVGLAFVGAQRAAAVEHLVADFRACCEDQGSRLVLVEGHPGVGKTRVVQEFYERLCATQPAPSYWPGLLDKADASALQDRGRIRPLQFVCPPGARPSYAWVAVSCRLDEVSGVPTRALVEAVGASEVLMGRVIRPIGRARRLLGQLWRIAMVLVGMTAAILGSFGIGGLVAVVPGLVVAVTGLAFELREQSTRTARELKHLRHEHAHREVMIDIAESLEGVSLGAHARANGFLSALAKRGIPGIVVIDDAQWADDDTVSLVDALLGRSLPMLVIATVRPTPFEDQYRLRQGLGRVVREYRPKTRRISLEPLAQHELAAAVLARAPGTDPTVAAAIAEHAEGNPLVLAGTLDQPLVRRSLHDGAYRIAEPTRELAEFPRDPRGVFESYWEQLPEPVSQLLALATLHGNLVEPAALCIGYRAALMKDPTVPLAEAREPFFWLVPLHRDLDRFADPILFDAAARHAHGVVSQAELLTAMREMIGELVRLRRDEPARWNEMDDTVRRVLLRLHVRGATDGTVDADPLAAQSATQLAELLDGPSEAAVSLETAELGIAWAADDLVLVDRAKQVCSDRLRELGRIPRLVEVLEELLEHRTATAGALAHPTLATRRRLAEAVMRLGQLEKASSMFDDLVPVLAEHLGSSELLTLEARRDQAMCLRALAKVDDAIACFVAVIGDDIAALGADHRETMIASNELAKAYMDKGHLQEALDVFRRVLESRTRVFGPDHPDTLKTRGDLANVLFLSGHYQEGVGEAEDLLAVRLRVLGSDHEETIRTRGTIAILLWREERLDEAIELSRRVLEDSMRVLGPEHIETLRYRNNLAAMLGTVGRFDEALEEFRTLAADQERLLGPMHREALRTKGNIAAALSDLGHHDASISMFEALIGDEQHMLGPKDPDTLGTRLEFANVLRKAGALDRSVAEFRAVLGDQEEALGREHPDTLRSQLGLADVLVARGHHSDAVAVLHAVRSDSERALGADHQITRAALEQLEKLQS